MGHYVARAALDDDVGDGEASRTFAGPAVGAPRSP